MQRMHGLLDQRYNTTDVLDFSFLQQKDSLPHKLQKIFPSFSTMPTLSNKEVAILTAKELVDAMKKLKKSKTLKIKSAHKEKY